MVVDSRRARPPAPQAEHQERRNDYETTKQLAETDLAGNCRAPRKGGEIMHKRGDKIRYMHSGYAGMIGKIVKVEKDEKPDPFGLKYEVELFQNRHRVWVREDWIKPLEAEHQGKE